MLAMSANRVLASLMLLTCVTGSTCFTHPSILPRTLVLRGNSQGTSPSMKLQWRFWKNSEKDSAAKDAGVATARLDSLKPDVPFDSHVVVAMRADAADPSNQEITRRDNMTLHNSPEGSVYIEHDELQQNRPVLHLEPPPVQPPTSAPIDATNSAPVDATKVSDEPNQMMEEDVLEWKMPIQATQRIEKCSTSQLATHLESSVPEVKPSQSSGSKDLLSSLSAHIPMEAIQKVLSENAVNPFVFKTVSTQRVIPSKRSNLFETQPMHRGAKEKNKKMVKLIMAVGIRDSVIAMACALLVALLNGPAIKAHFDISSIPAIYEFVVAFLAVRLYTDDLSVPGLSLEHWEHSPVLAKIKKTIKDTADLDPVTSASLRERTMTLNLAAIALFIRDKL